MSLLWRNIFLQRRRRRKNYQNRPFFAQKWVTFRFQSPSPLSVGHPIPKSIPCANWYIQKFRAPKTRHIMKNTLIQKKDALFLFFHAKRCQKRIAKYPQKWLKAVFDISIYLPHSIFGNQSVNNHWIAIAHPQQDPSSSNTSMIDFCVFKWDLSWLE